MAICSPRLRSISTPPGPVRWVAITLAIGAVAVGIHELGDGAVSCSTPSFRVPRGTLFPPVCS
jgi:hypothetical protein